MPCHLLLQPRRRVCVLFLCVCVIRGCEYIHPPSTPTLEQTQPPSLPFSPHNILFFVVVFFGAAFSSSLLTVDCKCPNLGRQPFLITRITLLSDRKIKLNSSIAYSWSQTAALRTHQSPLKLFHAPPSTHTHTHLHTSSHSQTICKC